MILPFPTCAFGAKNATTLREDSLEELIADLKGQCSAPSTDISTTLCNNCGSSLSDTINIPESPVPDLYATNQVPSEKDSANIRAALDAVQPDALCLDQEIARVQSLLAHLFNERLKLKEYESGHKALLTPMRRLLPEILSEIFIHCLPEELCTPHEQVAPLLLTRVCRRWREIALATPRLWSFASFVVHGKTSPARLAGITQWLARSGSAPLTLQLCYPLNDADSYSENELDSLLEATTATCDRWSSVMLAMRVTEAQRLSKVKRCLPLLRDLDLQLSQSSLQSQPSLSPSTSSSFLIDLFENATELRSVTFSGPLLAGPSLIKLPWDQLTELKVFHHDYFTAVDILRNTPNLVNCHFSIFEEPGSGDVQLQEVRLERLESLRCVGGTAILTVITAPSLREIELHPPEMHVLGVETPVWLARFRAFMIRSRCKLEKLCVMNLRDMSDQEFMLCLQETPDVVDLHVATNADCTAISDAFLRRLMSPLPPEDLLDGGGNDLAHHHCHARATHRGRPSLLPKLEQMLFSTDVTFSADTLSEVVLSRWNAAPGVGRISKVELYLWGARDRDEQADTTLFEKLEPLKEEGLDFVVYWR